MHIRSTVLSLVFAVTAFHAAAQSSSGSWWDERPWNHPDRGFNWYPPDQPPSPPKVKSAEEPASSPKGERAARKLEEIRSLAELKDEVAWRKEHAIMNPSRESLRAYLEAQKFSMDKSAYFADVWRRTIWQSPDLDYNAKFPTTNSVAIADRPVKQAQRQATLAELGKDYGLVFFFRSDCRYCEMQAPVLKLFAQSFKMSVLAVSMDGGAIAQFPEAKLDNGISRVVSGGEGVNTVPALYLVSRDKKRVMAVGVGVLAADEIAERIRVLAGTQPGEEL